VYRISEHIVRVYRISEHIVRVYRISEHTVRVYKGTNEHPKQLVFSLEETFYEVREEQLFLIVSNSFPDPLKSSNGISVL
jgi:hypothetical protein